MVVLSPKDCQDVAGLDDCERLLALEPRTGRRSPERCRHIGLASETGPLARR